MSSTHSEISNTPSFLDDPKAAFAFYQQEGYWIEPNVFSAAECDQLISHARQLSQAKKGNFSPVMMPHREDAFFMKAMKQPKIIQIMHYLVGGKVAGLQSQFFFTKPGTRGFSAHQDNFYVESEATGFASAWTALVDTGEENGGLVVYPKSNQAGNLPTKKLSLEPDPGQDPNANTQETIVPPIYPPLKVNVKRGSTLFIHGHLVHSSIQNTSNDFRYALLNTYIRSGAKFRAGNTAKREEIDLS